MVKLQGGDEYFLQMWRKLVDITMSQNQITYDRLNVTLTRDDVMGESLSQPDAAGDRRRSESQRAGG
ncbi:arginine--tRNA ligase [Klebsiella pneumoniae subsp. pneumoniae]|nr:arginine--tRNA ligase [Klebsiella pneumoniae subsp. pneumoniae]